MPVFRVEKNTNYTTMSNHHLRDKNLSLRAKGLLSLCLSLPDDWDYSIRGLVTQCKEGKDSIIAVLQEMQDMGYLKREQKRSPDGRMGNVEYIIFEEPQLPCAESPCSGKPNTVKPNTVKPNTVKPNAVKPNAVKPNAEKPNTEKPNAVTPDAGTPNTEKPPQLNKEVINKEEQNTNLTKNGKTKETREYGLYQNVLLSEDDVRLLQKEYPSVWMDWVEKLSEYMASTGKSYGNHLATIRSWAKKEAERNMPKRYVYDRFPRTEEDSL